jgi:hypothetical protein
MRLKTAALTAVLVGSLAGPSVLNASAATRAHSTAASRASSTRASVRSHRAPAIRKATSVPADATDPGPNPVGVVESVITEVQFVLSGPNIQAILWDLPGFGPY